MRFAKRLLLLAVMAMAAMAFAASSASAQVEVSAEGDGHCSPCIIHASSEGGVALYAESEEVFGDHIEHIITVCGNEFSAEIFEDGTGEIHDQALSGPPTECTTVPCNSTNAPTHNSEWPLLLDEPSAGVEHLLVNFCIFGSLQQPVECTIELAVITSGPHDYEFATDPNGNGRAECVDPITLFVPGHGFVEFRFGVQGVWHIEGTPIEVSH